MVLQVLPHPGQVGDHVHPERGQVSGVADTGELQQLRRVDRAAAQDDLTRADLTRRPAAVAVRHAHGPVPLEQDPGDEGPAGHVQVRPAHHRVQVGAGRAEPPAPVDVAVEGGEAFLAEAVDVLGELVPSLLDRFEERLEERAGGRAALEHQRAVAATELIRPGQAGLHPLEVGQAVRVVPAAHARVRGPALVVQRVAALEDHPVDAAGTAEHLSPGVVDAAAVQVRFGLRLVLPVVEPAADRERERGRHVDEDIPPVVRPPGLQDEHAGGRVGGEPVGEGAARRATADDHEVVARPRHAPSHPAAPAGCPAAAPRQRCPGGGFSP